MGLNIFDFITGSANFSVTRRLVDVDLDGDEDGETGAQLDDAGLLTIGLSNLTLSVGVPGIGLTVSGGNLGIATINEVGGQARVWTAVSANAINVTLTLPGITASVNNVTLAVGSGPADLDWTKAIDLDAADGFEAAGAVDPGETLAPEVDLTITLVENSVSLSGALTNLNVFDFITGGASFAVTRKLVDVDLDGDGNALTGEQLNDAGLLTIGLSSLTLSVGIPGVRLRGDRRLDRHRGAERAGSAGRHRHAFVDGAVGERSRPSSWTCRESKPRSRTSR